MGQIQTSSSPAELAMVTRLSTGLRIELETQPELRNEAVAQQNTDWRAQAGARLTHWHASL